MIDAPFDRRAIENALRAWFTDVVGITLIHANQDGPQPALPYATFQLGPMLPIGQEESRIDGEPTNPQPGAEVEIASVGLRRCVVSFNAYAETHGKATPDAQQHLDKAQAGLALTTRRDVLRAAGIGVVGVGPVQALDFLVSDRMRSRAQLDVTICVASNAAERVSYIEFAEVTAPDLGWNPETFTVVEP